MNEACRLGHDIPDRAVSCGSVREDNGRRPPRLDEREAELAKPNNEEGADVDGAAGEQEDVCQDWGDDTATTRTVVETVNDDRRMPTVTTLGATALNIALL